MNKAVAGILAILLAGIFLSGCTTSLELITLYPPEIPEAAGIKTIGVLNFVDDDSNKMRSIVEGCLVSHRVRGAPYFMLADRTNIEQVIDELEFQYSDLTQEENAREVGRLLNVQAIITGVIHVASVSDHQYTEERKRCNEDTDECEDIIVSCSSRLANFGMSIKIILVETGQIVFQDVLEGEAMDQTCEDLAEPLVSDEQLLLHARKMAAEKVLSKIAPTEVNAVVRLWKYEGSNENIKDIMERAIEWLGANRYERGVELIEEAYSMEPDNLALIYNMGLAQEIKGDLDKALSYYNEAESHLNRPDYNLVESIERVERGLSGNLYLDNR